MVTVRRVTLHFVVVILIRINDNVALPFNTFDTDVNVLGILSKLLRKHSEIPLIVVIKRSGGSNAVLRASDRQAQSHVGVGETPLVDITNEEKTKQLVKEILRSTGDENDPIVKKTNLKFKNALRDRCSAYYKCDATCKPKPKKKKDDCQKSCKEVFDYLMLCHPPGSKTKKKPSKQKQKKKDSCESSVDCGVKKDSCERDTCDESKGSCASRDSCADSKACCPGCTCTSAKNKDFCESSKECDTTKKPKIGTGKTMPPKWRY